MNYPEWIVKHFESLTADELYKAMQLREKVFVVEQACPYLDADGKDLKCYHIIAFDKNKNVVAASRIAPPGVIYNEPSIGRVVTEKTLRRTGLGKALFKRSMDFCEETFGKIPVKIMAQSYLVMFYENFGFEVCSDEFMEDGIPHVYMITK